MSMLERAANVRRGTIRAVQVSLQPMEARTAAQAPTTSLPERLEGYRITRALESRLPGLAEKLRHHGESVVKLARAGAVLTERLIAIARAKRAARRDERDYWQEMAEQVSTASEHAQAQNQARGRGR